MLGKRRSFLASKRNLERKKKLRPQLGRQLFHCSRKSSLSRLTCKLSKWSWLLIASFVALSLLQLTRPVIENNSYWDLKAEITNQQPLTPKNPNPIHYILRNKNCCWIWDLSNWKLEENTKLSIQVYTLHQISIYLILIMVVGVSLWCNG